MAAAFAAYRTLLVTRPYLTSAVTSAIVLAAGDALAQSIEHHRYLTAHPSATALTNPALSFQPNRTFILSLWGGAVFSPFFTRFFHHLETRPYLKAKSPRNLAIRVTSIFLIAQPLNAFFFLYCSTLEYLLPVDRLGASHIDANVVGPSSNLLEPTPLDVPSPPRPTPTSSTALTATHSALPFEPASPRLPSVARAFPPPSSSLLSVEEASPVSGESSLERAYRVITARTVSQLVEKGPTVVRNAALVWGPFNLVNQSIVPVQWRVVSGSLVSVLWNAYLSITAHEEVKGQTQPQQQ